MSTSGQHPYGNGDPQGGYSRGGYGEPQTYGGHAEGPSYGAPQGYGYGAPQGQGYGEGRPQDYTDQRGYGLAPSADERSMAILAHLSTLAALLLSAGWLSFVGPLLVWLLFKDRSEFVRRSAAGAFNFNLSMWVLSIAGWICIFTFFLIPVGAVLLFLSWIGQLVFHIVGAMRASRGELYRYPMQFIRVLS